ncbi:MAG: hypothetical protein ACRCUY_10320 [Thermoguttaceae bacterium]
MRQKHLIQKLAYLGILVILLVILYWIGRPAKVSVDVGGGPVPDSGGKLARLREKEKLSESQIGEVDPASSAVKLATFGMRGIALAAIWHRAQELQKKKDWNNVIAASKQLVFLEPHFAPVWEYLGWNLAYNASAEFDDYRERYRWMIRGIDFLIRGVQLNQHAPKLTKATGWTISQKIGIADENEQYRRLLREDDGFWKRLDESGEVNPNFERDNWLLGRVWYDKGEKQVKDDNRSIGNESDFLFFSNSRLNLFNYAMWKRKDGIFGEEAMRAWKYAGEEWRKFASMILSSAIPEDGSMRMKPGVKPKMAKLETTDEVREEEKSLNEELAKMAPGLKESLAIERWKELAEKPGQQGVLVESLEKAETDEFKIIRDWLDKNDPNWKEKLKAELDSLYSSDQLELKKTPLLFLDETDRDNVSKADGVVAQLRGNASEFLKITPKVLARSIIDSDEYSRDVKSRAREIDNSFDGFRERTRMSDLFRGILNYEYRLNEVDVESTQQADDARRLRHEGRVAYYDGRIADSIDLWTKAMAEWDKLFKKPGLEFAESDPQFIRGLIDIVEKFVIILDNANRIFPENTPMQGMIRNRLNQENDVAPLFVALDYAKDVFDRGDYPLAEKYFRILCDRFSGINQSIEFMKLAPLSDVRDAMIEANGYYVKSFQKQNKPLPDPLPLRSFVELMINHDPLIEDEVDAIQQTRSFIEKDKIEEAQKECDKGIELARKILDKYPLIISDPTLRAHADIANLAAMYVNLMNRQEKEVPNDFFLKSFMKR